MYFNYKSHKGNFLNVLPTHKNEAATTPNCKSEQKPVPADGNIFILNSQSIYSIYLILYTGFSLKLSAPKQITHVQTIISEHEQKWCKMGSRSHSNLFDKKRWGWGTGAGCRHRQQQKERGLFFWFCF